MEYRYSLWNMIHLKVLVVGGLKFDDASTKLLRDMEAWHKQSINYKYFFIHRGPLKDLSAALRAEITRCK